MSEAVVKCMTHISLCSKSNHKRQTMIPQYMQRCVRSIRGNTISTRMMTTFKKGLSICISFGSRRKFYVFCNGSDITRSLSKGQALPNSVRSVGISDSFGNIRCRRAGTDLQLDLVPFFPGWHALAFSIRLVRSRACFVSEERQGIEGQVFNLTPDSTPEESTSTWSITRNSGTQRYFNELSSSCQFFSRGCKWNDTIAQRASNTTAISQAKQATGTWKRKSVIELHERGLNAIAFLWQRLNASEVVLCLTEKNTLPQDASDLYEGIMASLYVSIVAVRIKFPFMATKALLHEVRVNSTAKVRFLSI
ncbi:unnamed protein product [Albugo candida]|uniref:Uncharacterized protein n=1 Tax=Albugo candida TaxID=65357 RepID=A0A024GRI3_9STRA|nr:unnamed protein product [Albugo candida]|eukprot:CCI49509.1 unnamed protein product [Albugo candida]